MTLPDSSPKSAATSRWYTLVPKNFTGKGRFLDRDSGLLCRGFEIIGRNPRAVLLGPSHEDEWPLVLRASMSDMTSPVWWRSLGIEGIVMFSWGDPGYQLIANAIVAAGVHLVQVTDTHGVISPLADAPAHLRVHWEHRWNEPAWRRILRTVLALPSAYLIRPLTKDRARVRMMTTGEAFCGATPEAVERYRRLVRRLAGAEAAKRIHLLPIPVNPAFDFTESDTKLDQVIALGRWDILQKRWQLLARTITIAVNKRDTTRFRIFGKTPPEMLAWHEGLPPKHRDRIVIEGFVPNDEVALAFRHARVMLVSSAYEGCHIASAEAVCSGASVVGCRSPFLSAVAWHAGADSGQLAKRPIPEELAAALLDELELWDRDLRNPHTISRTWCQVFHADKVALRAIEIGSGS